MPQFDRLATGIDVAPLIAEIDAQPQLWDRNPNRRMASDGPHRGMTDIWLRYRALHELVTPQSFRDPHEAVFYPAWHALPAARPIVGGAIQIGMRCGLVTRLGGILITRIPPGGEILPHHDRGSWHAETHNTKLYIPLRTNPDCAYHSEGETCIMEVGDVWTFDNLKVHSVQNRGDTERITLIVCLRTE